MARVKDLKQNEKNLIRENLLLKEENARLNELIETLYECLEKPYYEDPNTETDD